MLVNGKCPVKAVQGLIDPMPQIASYARRLTRVQDKLSAAVMALEKIMILARLHFFALRPHFFGGGILLLLIVLAIIAAIAFWPGNSQQK
jgi:hypothetical protein